MLFHSFCLFAADIIPDSSKQLPQPLNTLPMGGTIKITCNKENAHIIINNMELGKTPFCRSGFQPGFYKIELQHDECRPYSKMVLLEKNDTVLIDARLELSGSIQAPAAPVSPQPQPEISESDESDTKTPAEPLNHDKSFLSTVSGTINISCSIANATTYINKIAIGKAPLIKTGITPGYYEIEIKKDGYKPYYQMLRITGNDTVSVRADLISELSRLIIKSAPENARILLNDMVAGKTPFDTIQITPAIYNLTIELAGYVPVNKVITLTPGVTDSFSVALTTIAYRDSVRKVIAYKSKIARRIIFGLCTIGSTVGLISYNQKAHANLALEQKAWNRYMEPDLSGYEYDKRFEYYKSLSSSTDKYIRCRKAFTILSLISAAGLTISIPF